MKEKKYNKECADGVIKSLGLDAKRIEKCMGDPDADMENPVLKEEQDAQLISEIRFHFPLFIGHCSLAS
ncbi:hypothetical protein PVK06_000066 [Gossypium arboreum]|uniref:Vacuolar sorting receptor thioredoxin-like domain-containing protein n=1 Tax=Gossypium arboreum TaxID=29729 RepID=A0ABR0QX90_GOSAR|nr:hypothetical protein PVK06_000066 [Gossypium arboreum]